MSMTLADGLAPAAPTAGKRPVLPGLADPRTLKGAAARKARKERVFGNIPQIAFEQPIYLLRALGGSALIVSDPAGVKRVLIDNVANYPKTEMEQRIFRALFGNGLLGTDGELWRRHRRIMAPAFDPRSVAGYGPAISRACDGFYGHWDQLPPGGEVDIGAEMSRLTLRIIAGTMFSADSDDVIGLVAESMKDGIGIGPFSILDVLPVIGRMRMDRRVQQMAERFRPLDAAINRMIDARQKDPQGSAADLLGRLVGAHDEGGDAALTSREIRDQVITIFIAGHETTAQAMTWTWYLLSQHPAEEARLHEELDRVLGGRTPTQEDLPNLAFTRRVVEESMRIYPTAPGISARVAVADDEICGVKVRKGQAIAIAPWLLHHHKTLWDDPARFDPDRFLPERSAGRPRLAYMPFGAGPRVCIGQVLAMNEATLILAGLAQRYRLSLSPGQDIVPLANVTLRPKYGMRMMVERRV
ncbi:cytochrome P450 [Caulobacter sp. KR2-114]|uniref:cytochrome P450 n=1 Tax=Caulobacter sp. KR2-114 TaxID=3400912 RepID=UPI003BFF7D0B